ncbi:sporulation histidine kinase inhibitor Sda [Aneurinibacillus migulanus]|uniref:Sporulation inhibitor A n=1 Tax=Aneurinibacillus migulanus TaxID=47500 RepID=A0A1G9C0U5_ANEMI|nr:sporulation histidine kinase inhibitor Sda [Aneurinibacillus migulanus]MCP1355242.1 sporulation histidine kinase inhibitor Sda [Aneurinibacillus migulanus]MED0892023.1 sporulation histidine kinase inhibitor Sda [Aneurinibacillus migulanus]MED1618339.1 sporulation histidine kinase inhibitor Sda [Aneurinibacillus migulanus]MED4730049.1 sporulation histidine kinase inhibitor Sda [Aneurinibacillus migulanus]SDK45302.1 Sporulation inhibitor A [Aneurinibacillus migulanus]
MKRKNALSLLSNEELLKIYMQAISLDLESDFIQLIKAELIRRGIRF